MAGGNVPGGVVRVGDTVRKPAGPWTPAVEALLGHLHAAGFGGAPRSFGRDVAGRQMLEYVPGPMAHDLPPLDAAGLHRVGELVRSLHDACEGFEPPPGARWNVVIAPDRHDLICHHDLAPWNLVLGTDRWVFIDWDGAGPGSRLWDLAYTVTGFVPMTSQGDPAADGLRVRALADGYGLSAAQRRQLPPLIAAHTRAMFELLRDSARTGEQPWARLFAEGHGDYWGPAADYIERHLDTWRRALL
ncbi:MAG: phosphotransferase [Actinomycetota bacterium]|nr:phosphotransferase [Actinomycetota bacterium]